MNAVVMDGRWTSEAAVNVMPDPTAVEGRHGTLTTGSKYDAVCWWLGSRPIATSLHETPMAN